jgi:YHS domain-containing protein
VTRLVLLALLLLVIAWAFWRFVDGIIEAFGGLPPKSRSKTPVKLVRDPVCGTWVAPHNSLGLRAGDVTHYFCSDQCRDSFRTTRGTRHAP